MLTGASLQLTGAGKPDEEPRKLKYRGPVVYSNLPPPVLYFPSFPPDPKISSRGDAEEKSIEYVPFPYENLPLLVYQSDNQPPVHVVEKSRDSPQPTQPKDNNAKIQQQSGPAAPEMPDYMKNNQQQYQNTQPQAQKSSNTYGAAPQLFPGLENQRYLSIGISTYNAELPNNALYSVPQPAAPSSPPQKQNVVSYQVQNNARPNAQQQPSYTIAQNNAQKGQQQPLMAYNDNPQPNQYISNVAVQHQGQNVEYGQSQANFQRIPDQKPPVQNQYAQIQEQPGEIGYSVQQNYGPKQMPTSIQQLIHQQTSGDKTNSYQYSGPSVPQNSQSNSNYNMQQQGAVPDQPQVQKLQVQVQATSENVPDDDPNQQFLSIALYPYDIRGNNYKEEEKQFYKIVIPTQDGQNAQENSYGAQRLNPMEMQGQSVQYMKIGSTGPLEQPGPKQMNYPSNPMEMQKQVMTLQKPRAMIIQQPTEMQRQYAMKMQRQQAMDIQKQREAEIQKQREVELQKHREVEMQKQKSMNMRRHLAMEMQKRKVMAMQRQQAMEKQKQQMSQTRGQNLKSSNEGYQTEVIPDKANLQKQNTKQEASEKSPETEDDAIEYQQILIHIPHALAAQPQIVVQKGDMEQAVNPYTGTAQIASLKNDTEKLFNAVVTHIRQRPSYSDANKQQTITLQNSERFRGLVNSNFLKQSEFIKLPTENPAVSELLRHHYSYVRPRPKPSFRSRHPGAYASSNYHFATTNPIFLNSPSFPKNTFRQAPSYSFAEPPTLLQSSSHQYHNLFSSYPDELLAEASFQSPTYIPLVKPGQNAMSVLNAPQLKTSFPGPIKINAGPPPLPFGPMPHQMIYGHRNFPPPSTIPASSGKYGNFIKKLTTFSNIILSQSLGMKSQITPREETKEADEYNVEEVDDSTLRDDNVQQDKKEISGDSNTSVPKEKLSKRISKPEEDIPRPPIIVYKGPKPPVEVYGTKDDIEKGKSPVKKATMKQSSAKVDRNEEVDFVKTMYSILPKFVKRSITNRNDEDESDLADSEVDEGRPPKEGTIIDELEAFVDSDDETDTKVTSGIKDSVQSGNSNNDSTSAVKEDIEELMKLLHKEEKSDIFPS
ncbi:hypothetical protein AVEN_228982-1 [Araneus ventricosus]|uniref:Uncharacterized protein n=1 Tax=Araneus ventricosus TaxID=182803 RepID=A0A4Y2I6B9_ARAVE|nr:hypothetical protein AVEN_228982-1 [Araneus ventricosus]